MLMSRKILLIIILVLLLSLLSDCQRGGGSRSSGRSSSRSSYRSSSWGSSRSRNKFNIFVWLFPSIFGSSTTENITNSTGSSQNIQAQEDDQTITWMGCIGLGIFVLFFGFAMFLGKQNAKKRQDKIQKLMLDYEGRTQQNMCVLDDSAKARAIDWFMNQQWRIDFKAVNVWENSYQVKIADLKKVNDIKYEIKLTGTDSIGSSTSKGLLTFQKDYIALFFQKTYSNMADAGQTGAYDVLLYEGNQRGQEFYGKWYYNGFQGNPTYSGEWRMTHR